MRLIFTIKCYVFFCHSTAVPSRFFHTTRKRNAYFEPFKHLRKPTPKCRRANFKSSVTRCTVQPFSMNRFRHKPHKTTVFAITRQTQHRRTPPFSTRPAFKPSTQSTSNNRSGEKQSFDVPQSSIRLVYKSGSQINVCGTR